MTCPANLAFHRENWTPYRAATASPEFFPIRMTVDGLISAWLEGHPTQDCQLLVLHTHSHDDHTAGDARFVDRPGTIVVPAGRRDVYDYLGLTEDLDLPARLDLGGRVLECIASPGHDEAAVTFYDASTGLLLTGDTVYPGRLYVRDGPPSSQPSIGCSRSPTRIG